jgi:tetratricopeptide (TPR) repeat protein
VSLVTDEEVRTGTGDEERIQRSVDPLSYCYALAQDLITAWRETEERDPDLRSQVTELGRDLRRDPENAALWSNLGVVHWELGDQAEALRCLDRAIELEPSVHFLANRAAIHGSAGDRAAAVADLTRAIELDPGVAYVWYNRALIHRDEGRPDMALVDAERALKLEPGSSHNLLLRASILKLLGREEEALQDLQAARAAER